MNMSTAKPIIELHCKLLIDQRNNLHKEIGKRLKKFYVNLVIQEANEIELKEYRLPVFQINNYMLESTESIEVYLLNHLER